jgi:hypothetical protein
LQATVKDCSRKVLFSLVFSQKYRLPANLALSTGAHVREVSLTWVEDTGEALPMFSFFMAREAQTAQWTDRVFYRTTQDGTILLQAAKATFSS